MNHLPVAPAQPVTVYASTPDRIWGGVVDGVIVSILGYAAAFMAVLLHSAVNPGAYASSISENTTTTVMVIVMLVVYFAYFMIFELTSGRTPGKRLAGTQVISEDGFTITAWQSFLRNGFRLGGAVLLFSVPALIAIWKSQRKQRIGDMVAKTVVVKVGG